MRGTAILVTGMHRSGTSATAGVLAKAGVAMGKALLAAGPDNPKGYFENERAVAINERVLSLLERSWDDPRPMPTKWRRSRVAMEAVDWMVELIESEFDSCPLWALKDPRLCRLMPLWIQALERREVRPVALFVVRDPREVMASIHARNGWAPAVGELLWLRHMLEAEASTRDLQRTALTFDQLIADPWTSVSRTLHSLGVVLPGGARVGSLNGFVDANDRHHRGDGTRRTGTIARLASEVHDSLVAIAEGEDAWSRIPPLGRQFRRAWQSFGPYVEGVAEMTWSARKAHAQDVEKLERVRSDLNAQVAWSKDAVAKQEHLHAENARLQSELTAQLEWAEEAVARQRSLADEVAASQALVESQVAVLNRDLSAVRAALAEARADRDRVRSELNAQVSWSEGAARRIETLQAEVATVRSDLTAQLQWSEAAVKERERLQEENARIRSDLHAQLRWSEEAMRIRESLREDVAGLTTRLAQTEAAHSAAAADWQLRSLDHARTIEAKMSEIQSLRDELEGIRASLSWRATGPFRAIAGSIAVRLHRRESGNDT